MEEEIGRVEEGIGRMEEEIGRVEEEIGRFLLIIFSFIFWGDKFYDLFITFTAYGCIGEPLTANF